MLGPGNRSKKKESNRRKTSLNSLIKQDFAVKCLNHAVCCRTEECEKVSRRRTKMEKQANRVERVRARTRRQG